jgi:hypothetical protein
MVAKVGIGIVPHVDAVYPMYPDIPAGIDYVMHFKQNELPPCNAFWSLTMYDEEGFPVVNDAKRYAVGSKDDLHFEKDGSLLLLLSPTPPTNDLYANNWLPAPGNTSR